MNNEIPFATLLRKQVIVLSLVNSVNQWTCPMCMSAFFNCEIPAIEIIKFK